MFLFAADPCLVWALPWKTTQGLGITGRDGCPGRAGPVRGEMAPWLLTSSIQCLCGDFTWRHLKALCLRVPG